MIKNKHICFICWYYFPLGGGVETVISELAKSLIKQGNKVSVLTGTVKGTKREDEKDEVNIYRIEELDINEKSQTQENSVALTKYLNNFMKNKKVDIISVHNFHLDLCPAISFAINSACLINDMPLILTLHNYCNSPMSELLLKNLNWTKITGTTKGMAEHAYDLGIPAEKLTTIYNGVDIHQFKKHTYKSLRKKYKLTKKNKVIITPSRVLMQTLERKGLISLIKGVSIVKNLHSEIILMIVVAKPHPTEEENQKEALKKLCDLAKLYGIFKKNFKIIKDVDIKDMPKLYNISDLMVLPSLREPFGMVYIEAMGCQKPVIGCSQGGVPEIIMNTRTGYLIPEPDPTELSKNINWMLKANRLEEYGLKGRQIVEKKFSLEKMSKKFMKLFKEILADKSNK